MISERIKFNNNHGVTKNNYFWRTHEKQEIDYIEEGQGKLKGFEFKWNQKTFRKPHIFLDTYHGSTIELIDKDNFIKFLNL